MPATERERCRGLILRLLAASSDGCYRREVLKAAAKEGFGERYVVGVAKEIPGFVQVRQGRRPAIWRLAA